jgi:hypothetical protein
MMKTTKMLTVPLATALLVLDTEPPICTASLYVNWEVPIETQTKTADIIR